jgi:hypothetical protein
MTREASADDDGVTASDAACTGCGVLNEPAAETIAVLRTDIANLRNDIAKLDDRLKRD